ncbi:MAG: asparagine synthase-related protein [Psychroserpens sp.]|uniref:asparagine synthase-related protein n=1 Tax=Psychroserpens sp. TaxID=2020870 RepID=UPI0030013256
MDIKTDIIPIRQTFAKTKASHQLNLEAICVFAAIGFFLDKDTYWKDKVVLPPASINTLNDFGELIESKPWFHWYYSPRPISFNDALNEFTDLFETIIMEQNQDKKVILPLSGGLDSRTQATALKHINAKVFSYSYDFKNGFKETDIARHIAETCKFEFNSSTIKEGYLWDVLDELSELNMCYSDFTSPRQMSVFNKYKSNGDILSLGHWGDVLFDSMNLPQLTKAKQIEIISKKIIKKGGLDFANNLWLSWNLEGDFENYFNTRIALLLDTISIDDTNAKLRAFKSKYWAPRWTSINLSIFEAQNPISLPYYDNRMCEFICSIPEEFLKNRKLQIAYIKKRTPELASIVWQDQRPFNLNNFNYNKIPFNLPYRLFQKGKRLLSNAAGQTTIQRNWELQFLGTVNEQKLKEQLIDSNLEQWIPKHLINHYVDAFYNEDALQNAHTINMLLTFSKFHQNSKHE